MGIEELEALEPEASDDLWSRGGKSGDKIQPANKEMCSKGHESPGRTL